MSINLEVAVYHRIVEKIARRNFERVNDHDYAALLADCAPDVHHRFGGDHALGGERRGKEVLARWFDRLGRLGPDLRLEVRDVWVKGLPHDTTVILRWVGTQTWRDGTPYENHGVHVVRMRWFRVVDIDANEDSQLVAAWLGDLAARGVTEAAAEPITV